MGDRVSDIGDLRTAAAEARTAFDAALTAADSAHKSQTYYAFEVERWKLGHKAETREPRPITEGAAHYDIAMLPPPSDKEVKHLAKAAAAAEKKLNKARRALEAAAALSPPKRKPSTTGWVATKSFAFLGVGYDPGDPFDPGVAEPGKLARLIGARMVAPTSPAGVDHAS